MKAILGDWFWMALATALIWGFTAPLEKFGLRKIDPVAAIVARCLGALAGMIVITALRPTVWRDLSSVGAWPVLALVGAGLCGTVLGQFTNLHALKVGDISRVSPITGSWPMIAFLIAVLVYGEPVTVKKVVGALGVVGGIVLIRI